MDGGDPATLEVAMATMFQLYQQQTESHELQMARMQHQMTQQAQVHQQQTESHELQMAMMQR